MDVVRWTLVTVIVISVQCGIQAAERCEASMKWIEKNDFLKESTCSLDVCGTPDSRNITVNSPLYLHSPEYPKSKPSSGTCTANIKGNFLKIIRVDHRQSKGLLTVTADGIWSHFNTSKAMTDETLALAEGASTLKIEYNNMGSEMNVVVKVTSIGSMCVTLTRESETSRIPTCLPPQTPAATESTAKITATDTATTSTTSQGMTRQPPHPPQNATSSSAPKQSPTTTTQPAALPTPTTSSSAPKQPPTTATPTASPMTKHPNTVVIAGTIAAVIGVGVLVIAVVAVCRGKCAEASLSTDGDDDDTLRCPKPGPSRKTPASVPEDTHVEMMENNIYERGTTPSTSHCYMVDNYIYTTGKGDVSDNAMYVTGRHTDADSVVSMVDNAMYVTGRDTDADSVVSMVDNAMYVTGRDTETYVSGNKRDS